MLKLVTMIEKKIANEQQILYRCAEEVTVDWSEVQAEVRIKAIKEIEETVHNGILRSYGCSARPAS